MNIDQPFFDRIASRLSSIVKEEVSNSGGDKAQATAFSNQLQQALSQSFAATPSAGTSVGKSATSTAKPTPLLSTFKAAKPTQNSSQNGTTAIAPTPQSRSSAIQAYASQAAQAPASAPASAPAPVDLQTRTVVMPSGGTVQTKISPATPEVDPEFTWAQSNSARDTAWQKLNEYNAAVQRGLPHGAQPQDFINMVKADVANSAVTRLSSTEALWAIKHGLTDEKTVLPTGV